MRHPLHTRDGVSHEYRAVYNDATDRIEAVAVAAKTASFDSRDANRDSYTVEILVLHQIPPRHFSSTGDGQMRDKLSFRDNLTFHGVMKLIMFDAARADKAGQLLVTGAFRWKWATTTSNARRWC